MATQCTQESVLQFLIERGGRVKNVELIDRFKSLFPSDPAQRALAKEAFKTYVDNVAFVKAESGAKYVCLRKKYAASVNRTAEGADGQRNGNDGSQSTGVHPPNPTSSSAVQEMPNGTECGADSGNGQSIKETPTASIDSLGSVDETPPSKSTAHVIQWISSPGENGLMKSVSEVNRDTEGARPGGSLHGSEHFTSDIHVTVVDSTALSMDTNKKGFKLNTSSSSDSGTLSDIPACKSEDDASKGGALCMDGPPTETLCMPEGAQGENEECKDVPPTQSMSKWQATREFQQSQLKDTLGDGADEGVPDSTDEGNTPRSSRRNFIELMMSSSPQVRRSLALRNSAKHRDAFSLKSDSDSASLDEDSGSAMLDPLEHQWMMCASDGQWDSLSRLLTCEPTLVVKKDFVTGFTCLHWAAKQGKQELLALLVNFAKQHDVPVNINARSSAGYTPLHLAAMHNHIEVVKLLVGAYDANVEVRDYSGRKAAHYLPSCVSDDVRDIIGACADSDCESPETVAGKWRFSKVLQTNFKLLNHPEEDSCDFVKPKPLYRKPSVGKMKPRLQKIKFKTQIVHSTSFREPEEGDNEPASPLKSRPKSNLFG
ncbi:ankyrin repeat domain-containing protein SOWAHC-like [Brienomyrus brachyistius]|uniref:ankyrin repeat domain-containing protein SOWAHC-like n=1 Tax=Brienomyrus brachyistius TaxID=42636 RepID=UPI0020B239B3|nr:ankyrin repeat domain-containing protein SOWAHC-like [Brienomyrus brachyistius]